MILLIALLILGYLAGSIPTAIIVGQVTRGIDIRQYGSGNAGATNVFRVMGWKAALVVVMVDVFKGWFSAAVIANWTFNGTLGDLPFHDPNLAAILCGAAAVLGHTYTIFAGFKGGKGVGALAGMVLHLFPLAVLLALAVWIVIILLTGYVSVGSVTAVTLFPLVVYFREGTLINSLGIFSLVIVAFIWFTHRSNARRLIAGEEHRFDRSRLFRKSKA